MPDLNPALHVCYLLLLLSKLLGFCKNQSKDMLIVLGLVLRQYHTISDAGVELATIIHYKVAAPWCYPSVVFDNIASDRSRI